MRVVGNGFALASLSLDDGAVATCGATAKPMADSRFALSIHTSSPSLALALTPFPWVGDVSPRVRCRQVGQSLSRTLHGELLELLPAPCWSSLVALAVATGPGGFTGTRLGVVLARTLAQQLQIPLIGCGSFLLMARRLSTDLRQRYPEGCRLQLVQPLRRRGWILSRYRIDRDDRDGVVEETAPHLDPTPPAQEKGVVNHVVDPAAVDAVADAIELLRILRDRLHGGDPGCWRSVLPLYPAAAVDR